MYTVGSSFQNKAISLGRENITWKMQCCILVDTIFFSFLCQISCSFTLITTWLQQQRWQSADNLGFDNNVKVEDWWTTLALIAALMVNNWGFHFSLHYICARATARFKQRTLTCILRQKHTTISHDRYAGLQIIPATSLIGPNIFGPLVTTIDRFHYRQVPL